MIGIGLFLKGLLTNKYFWGALCVTILMGMFYGWAYYQGVHSRDQEVVALRQERDEALNKVRIAKVNADNQKAAYEAAKGLYMADTKATMALLSAKLDDSQSREKKLKEKLNGIVTTYITPKADADCRVPTGFVRLHDLSAKGLDPTIAAQASAVPGGGSENVDSPTGVKLSDIGRTVANNYGECQSRLEIIESWQTWYTRSLDTWRKASAVQADYKTLVLEPPK